MIFPLIGILVGIILILFRRKFAKKLVYGQNKTWGFRFGETDQNITSIITAITGFLLLLFNGITLIRWF